MAADAVTETALSSRVRTRFPRSLNVVWDPPPEEVGAMIDWSAWYLTDEEDMGEGCEQNLIIRALISMLTELSRERGWKNVHIGADQFFAWIEEEPLVRVSPDVYLLDDPPPRPLPKSWQTWREDHRPPRLAIEIVSEDWQKDYNDNPPKYSQLGTSELIIFDPEAATGAAPSAERVALQVFRREADGGFVRVHRGDGPARCDEIDAWLMVRREGAAASLGVARDVAGQDLVPTSEERIAALEAELERFRQK